jgi:hypothetical protein
MGQGRRVTPPEPTQRPKGPAACGHSFSINLSRVSARGTNGSIPSKASVNQKHVCKAGGVSIGGTIRLLVSKYHPPLASHFLGPNPVFEIKPQGLGLRGEPVPPAGFGASPNAPGDVSPPLGLRVPVSAGDGPSPSSRSRKQMSRKDAHAFAASLAATLMVSIVVFQAGDGTYGAVPADEIDGDEVVIVSEYDPFA